MGEDCIGRRAGSGKVLTTMDQDVRPAASQLHGDRSANCSGSPRHYGHLSSQRTLTQGILLVHIRRRLDITCHEMDRKRMLSGW